MINTRYLNILLCVTVFTSQLSALTSEGYILINNKAERPAYAAIVGGACGVGAYCLQGPNSGRLPVSAAAGAIVGLLSYWGLGKYTPEARCASAVERTCALSRDGLLAPLDGLSYRAIDVKGDLERFCAGEEFPLITMKARLQAKRGGFAHAKGLASAIANFMGWSAQSKSYQKKTAESLVKRLNRWDGQLDNRILAVLYRGAAVLHKVSNEALLAINNDPRFTKEMRNYQKMLQRKQELALKQQEIALQKERIRVEQDALREQREYHNLKLKRRQNYNNR